MGWAGAITRVIALLAVSFLVQSTLVVVVVLVLARVGTRTAVVRAVIYQAAFAAVAVLPFVSVLFYFSSDALQVEAVLAPWGPAARGAAVVVTGVWGVGALLGLLRILWAHRAMRALRQRAVRLHNPAIREGLSELAWYARVETPEVLVSDEVRSPMLTGFLNPAIILPDSLAECSVDEGLLAVLQHELAHQTRHDCLAKLLADVLCALFFFQPLLRLMATWMEQAADEAADDMVLSGGATAREYARLLCEWAEEHLGPSERAAIGIGRFRSALGRRVERITAAARSLITKVSRLATGGIAYTMALLCILVALLTIQGSIWILGGPGPPPAVPPAPESEPPGTSPPHRIRSQPTTEAASGQPTVEERSSALPEAHGEPEVAPEDSPPEPGDEPVDGLGSPHADPTLATIERVELVALPPRLNWPAGEIALGVHMVRVNAQGMPIGRRERFELEPPPEGYLVETTVGGQTGELLGMWARHSDGWRHLLRRVAVRRDAGANWVISSEGMDRIQSLVEAVFHRRLTFCKQRAIAPPCEARPTGDGGGASENGSSEATGTAPDERDEEEPGG